MHGSVAGALYSRENDDVPCFGRYIYVERKLNGGGRQISILNPGQLFPCHLTKLDGTDFNITSRSCC